MDLDFRLPGEVRESRINKETTVGQSEAQVFKGITPEQFAKLTAKAQAAGIGLNRNSGTAEKFGVEVEWNYQPETQELTLHCLRTPFFVKMEDVNAKIKAMVKDSLA